MRYRLAIFDFDGTLADSLPWMLQAMNQAADQFAFRKLEAAEVELLRGQDARQILRRLGLPSWKLPLVARYMRAQMGQEIGSIALFAGVEAALEQLSHAGVELAIVSSNSDENVRRVLGPRNAELIRHYECGASLFGKAARLRRVLRASRIEPGAAIYIGDELRDLHAAHAVRMAFGAVAWGVAPLDSLVAHAPEERFNHVAEIPLTLGTPGAEG